MLRVETVPEAAYRSNDSQRRASTRHGRLRRADVDVGEGLAREMIDHTECRGALGAAVLLSCATLLHAEPDAPKRSAKNGNTSAICARGIDPTVITFVSSG